LFVFGFLIESLHFDKIEGSTYIITVYLKTQVKVHLPEQLGWRFYNVLVQLPDPMCSFVPLLVRRASNKTNIRMADNGSQNFKDFRPHQNNVLHRSVII
jgi:hypothetical protein